MSRPLLPCLVLISVGVVVHSFNLTILHTNDIHARIEEANKYGGQCSQDDAQSGKCFGGFARLKTKVKELRASYPDTLLLDAGDQYSGSLWFYKYGGEGIATFMNYLGYDAMGLGNHEFDRGPSGLVPFLNKVNFSVLSANIITEPSSELHGAFQKSTIVTIGGERIGIVGYTTTDTETISNPGPLLSFEDEVEAVGREVTSLQEQGINKIIAVGHAGFSIDKQIAERVPGVDVIIGGHDNTFLYSGDLPSNDEPEGDYPHVVTQKNGARVLVVQDFQYGKYLGELHVVFDIEGGLTSWYGNPVLLDNNIAQDAATVSFLAPYKQQLQAELISVVGRSHVRVEGEREVCRSRECTMGNLVTDAMVRFNLRYSDTKSWSNVSIAIQNGGGIRASFEKGDITVGDVQTTLPFSSTIDIVELYGRHLLEVLEHSVSIRDIFAGYLQVSGLRVEYNLDRPVGRRVVRARALCTQCEVPVYEDIVANQVYPVVMTSFLAGGGDRYTAISNNIVKHHIIGSLDYDVLVDYIKKFSPIIQAEEERTVFVSSPICEFPSSGAPRFQSSLFWFLSLIMFGHFAIYTKIITK